MKYLFPYIFERYLARQIYAAFGFILFALVALFLFFDILSELGSVKGQYTLPLALLHVFLKAPSRISEIIPIAGLIGSIYVFAMLASQSEFTILRIVVSSSKVLAASATGASLGHDGVEGHAVCAFGAVDGELDLPPAGHAEFRSASNQPTHASPCHPPQPSPKLKAAARLRSGPADQYQPQTGPTAAAGQARLG